VTTAGDYFLSNGDTVMIAAIEAGLHLLAEARNLIAGFNSMIRKKLDDDLEPWIADTDKTSSRLFSQGYHSGPCCRSRRDHRTMVQRSNGGHRSPSLSL